VCGLFFGWRLRGGERSRKAGVELRWHLRRGVDKVVVGLQPGVDLGTVGESQCGFSQDVKRNYRWSD
jgi:hypothetical protein